MWKINTSFFFSFLNVSIFMLRRVLLIQRRFLCSKSNSFHFKDAFSTLFPSRIFSRWWRHDFYLYLPDLELSEPRPGNLPPSPLFPCNFSKFLFSFFFLWANSFFLMPENCLLFCAFCTVFKLVFFHFRYPSGGCSFGFSTKNWLL